jgi:glycosyltransferase involved in cell wall biosynthesis
MNKKINKLPDGWFHDGDIKQYRLLVEQVPDGGTIIELGPWKGRSLCSVADIIKRKKLKVYAVDTFEGTRGEKPLQDDAKEHNIKEQFENNIKKHGIEVETLAMTTNEAAKKLDMKFDLIFIDADHSYGAFKQDLENWLPKCKGIIAGHDYELEDISSTVDKAFPNVDYTHVASDPGRSTMWWHDIRKKPNTDKKLDVIIPAYKAQETIERTLCSIVMQSIVGKLSVIIVNDCDGIGYEKFVKQFQDYVEIKEIVLKVNGGPGVARQAGIDAGNSPYFTCIDADDTFAGAFALEILLKAAQGQPEFHTIVGAFAEQHNNLQFVNHTGDLVWMFGKLYTRAFINKYKIRFNETRANEDNGFNTIIRLVSSETERIMFIPDIVYYWHSKGDSITRVNYTQYSYDQSFVGYTDNMIYAIKSAKKVKPFNNYIDMWAIQVMAQLYNYYYQTVKRDTRFIEQNYNSCVKYYKEVFGEMYEKMDRKNFDDIFAQTLSEQAPNMKDNVPDKTIYQFIEELKNK